MAGRRSRAPRRRAESAGHSPLEWLAGVLGRHFPRLVLRFGRPRGALLGLLGEELVARELVREGWRLLGRRLRTPHGEVDIVARVGRTLVVIEVKTGRVARVPGPGGPVLDLRWRPGLRLGRRQAARLARAAGWLARRAGLDARLEQVEVLVLEADWPLVRRQELDITGLLRAHE